MMLLKVLKYITYQKTEKGKVAPNEFWNRKLPKKKNLQSLLTLNIYKDAAFKIKDRKYRSIN